MWKALDELEEGQYYARDVQVFHGADHEREVQQQIVDVLQMLFPLGDCVKPWHCRWNSRTKMMLADQWRANG